MFQSLIVYGVQLVLMIVLGSVSRLQKNFLGIRTILLMLIFAVIAGLRYDVGVDHLTYLKFYEYMQFNKNIDFGFETAFRFIYMQFASLDAHYAWPFGVFALIQIFFILYAFKNEKYIYPFLVFVILASGVYFTMMNEIRQSIAWAIFIFSIQYAKKDSILIYLGLVLLAYMFHRSALLLLPLYFFITNRDIFKSITLQLLLLFFAIIISEMEIWHQFSYYLDLMVSYLGYEEKYFDIQSTLVIWDKDYSKGIRFYALIAINVITILESNNIKRLFNKHNIIKFYNLFFAGSLMSIILYYNTLLQRPVRYLSVIQVVILAYLMLYLWRMRSKSVKALIYFIILVVLHLVILIAYIASSHHTLYNFYWQIK